MRSALSLFVTLSFAAALLFAEAPTTPIRADMLKPAGPAAAPREFNIQTLRALRARLDGNDRLAALKALHLALSQLSDGATFVWRKKSRQLSGAIKPTMAFRNANGEICRHLIYSLSLGRYIKTIEGVACRDASGRWWLTG